MVATQSAPDPPPAEAGFSVTLTSYPLLVDGGRLRVTGDEHGVAAHPAAAGDDARDHWTYARSDHELIAMRLVGEQALPGPLVAALWDDGVLVALDARTGEPAWRARSVDEQAVYLESFDPAEFWRRDR